MPNDSSNKPHKAEPHFNPTCPAAKPVAGVRVPWSPWIAVLYAVAVYFAAQILASLLVVVYPRALGWSKPTITSWLNNSVVAQFWYVLLAEAITFGAIWWFVQWRHTSLRSIGWRGIRWWDIVVTLAGFAAYFVGYVLLLSIARQLFPSLNINQKQQLGFQNVTGSFDTILTFVSLVVLPPLVEETVFRGFIFTGLRNKMRWGWAALLTSIIFASAHLEFGSGQPLLWVAAIDTFTLSMVLCYLRQKTDSLWPGIMLHALKNGIAFVSLFLLHAN
jgi:membrane protease YdiL (CAAX protease family)